MSTGSAMSAFREYRTLLLLHIRTQLGLSVLRANWKQRKGRGKTVGIAVAMVYAVGVMLMLYLLMLHAVFLGIAALENMGMSIPGLAESLMSAILGSAMLVSFVLGSITLFSVVFHARDAALFASMPLRPRNIFAAKFSMVYGYELMFTLFLTLPAGLMYCVYANPVGGAVLFWLRLIPVVLTVPMTPLALAAAAAMGLARATRGAKRYERWNLVLQLSILAVALGFQMLMSGPISRVMGGDAVQGFLLEQGQTLNAVPGWFPPAQWAGIAVTGSGWTALGSAGLYALVSAGCMLLALTLSGRFYNAGLQTQTEVPRASGHGRIRTETPAKPAHAIARKEARILRRTSVYVMNVLIGPFIFPLMILLMFISQREAITELLQQAAVLDNALMALILGIVMSFGMMISGASTMFSREGKGLELMNALPLTVRDFLEGKISFYRWIGWGGVLLTAVMLLVMGMNAVAVGAGAVMALCAVWPLTEAHALRDCASPKLDWENETQAVKQNLNTMIGMLAALVAALPIAGAALITALLTGNVWLTVLVSGVISAVMTIPLRKANLYLTRKLINGA